MDQDISAIVGYAIIVALVCAGIFVAFLLVWIPVLIAKNRRLSADHISSIRMLTMIGILIGPVWIVALVLACVWPSSRRRMGPRSPGGDIAWKFDNIR